jgi:predicted nucleotidyltransferase
MVADPLVNRVVRRIVQAIHPERVILFGSRARGTNRPDSDLDLLVLYSGPKSKREVSLEIHQLFPRPDFSMDLFVMRPEEMESQRHIANTLAREAHEHGIVCHG